MSPEPQIPIFLTSPDLRIPTQTLTLDPHLPFHALLPNPLSFYLTFNGKPLLSTSTPALSRLPPLSTLTLRLRLPGGGGDGGATGAESRDCYLNMYAVKKPDKVDPNETRLSKWTTCALSFEPLSPPCVLDRLGNVFNKEALLQALLEKKLPKEFKHIKGLKDMIPIRLVEIPGADANAATRFQCPIAGLEFNGKYPFVALRGCGHVVSVKALKEVKSSGCLVCRREFSDSEKIIVNGSAEEVAALREKMEEERGKVREKKEKKVGGGVSGVKHKGDEKGAGLDDCRTEARAKRFKAVDIAPANATKEVYASIFTSSSKTKLKETYMCRSLPLGRN